MKGDREIVLAAVAQDGAAMLYHIPSTARGRGLVGKELVGLALAHFLEAYVGYIGGQPA